MTINKKSRRQEESAIYLSDNPFNLHNVQTTPGDSGGPLIYSYKDKYFLLGNNAAGTYDTSFFTSISYYATWIYEKTHIPYESGTYIAPYVSTILYPNQRLFDPCSPVKNIEQCKLRYGLCDWDLDINTCKVNIF